MGFVSWTTVGLSILLLVAQKPSAQDDPSSAWGEVGVQVKDQCPEMCDNVKDMKAKMEKLSNNTKDGCASGGSGGNTVAEESQDAVRMTYLNTVEITAIRYPQEKAFCGGKSRILTRLHRSTVARVTKVSECLAHCFRTGHSGVIQVTGAINNVRDCTCSSVPPHYMKLFPKRYLKCLTDSDPVVEIYYRSDLIPANVASMVKPLLFYALDDVSGITNIGSLTGEAYNARWDQGGGHFDCPYSDISSPTRSKLMSLNPAEMPMLRVVHSLNVPNDPGYTVMVWFKKASPAVNQVPILDATKDNTVNWAWHMWNFPNPGNIYLYVPNQAINGDSLLDQMGWNLMTMRAQGGTVSMELNYKRAGVMNLDKKDVNFGDQFTIGRRLHAGDPYNANPFNGCIAHVNAFDKVLTSEEMIFYSNLVKDDLF